MGKKLQKDPWKENRLQRLVVVAAGLALYKTGAAGAAVRKVKGWLGYGDQETAGASTSDSPATETVGAATGPGHGLSPHDVSVPVTPRFLNVPRAL